MNDKREIFGWTMYDWANSAFSTTVVTTFLGPYLLALAEEQGGVNVFGFVVEPAAFFPAVVSISVILQVILLPILGAVADYTHLKKRLMMLFAYTGAVATIALFFVTSDLVILGGLLFIAANLSFGAAVVFYNAFLPEIASPDRRDAVSSRGFAFGYLGGGLLLLLNLVMISLVIWAAIVIFAFAFLYEEWQLWILGASVALVLGGSQALSRSLFSQMIPSGSESEYFGLYEISERGTSWIGPLVFALAVQLTGTQRTAILSLIFFFIVGLVLLALVDVRKAIADSGHDPSGLTV